MTTKKNPYAISEKQARMVSSLDEAIKELSQKRELVLRTIIAGMDSIEDDDIITGVQTDPPALIVRKEDS